MNVFRMIFSHTLVDKTLMRSVVLPREFQLADIGRASLVFILRDVTRFVEFSCRLVQEVISLVFDLMLSLWGILVRYKSL